MILCHLAIRIPEGHQLHTHLSFRGARGQPFAPYSAPALYEELDVVLGVPPIVELLALPLLLATASDGMMKSSERVEHLHATSVSAAAKDEATGARERHGLQH